MALYSEGRNWSIDTQTGELIGKQLVFDKDQAQSIFNDLVELDVIQKNLKGLGITESDASELTMIYSFLNKQGLWQR